MGSSDFKPGQKVTVKSFAATVVGYHDETATLQVIDEAGGYHYVFYTQLENRLPYADGQKYVDSDGDLFNFRANSSNGPCWEDAGNVIRPLDYPVKPLRPVGEPVTED